MRGPGSLSTQTADVAIVGAGFTGTMLAVHLLRANKPLRVALIERSGRFTAGVAYGTRCLNHTLNVPAGRMSALPDDPEHFLRFARTIDAGLHGGSFVPRQHYGSYLAWMLSEAQSSAKSATLDRAAGEVVSICPQPEGLLVRLAHDRSMRTILAQRVVLAIGNFPPADLPVDDTRFYRNNRYVRDPWAPGALDLDPTEPVLLLGTGLTMFDIAIALRDRGHTGTIHAISRRGLLPQPHRESVVPPPHLDRPSDLDRWPRTAIGLLRSLRAEIDRAAQRGIDWREVVTSLRADTPALWKSLSIAERHKFLRHLRPFWETHRHRASPATAQSIQDMLDAGQLQIIAGRITGFDSTGDHAVASYRARGTGEPRTLRVSRVINCTGPDTNLSRVDDKLIQCLRRNGLIRPDALGLGLDSDESGRLIDSTGAVQERLFLVGPLRKGSLWENTAVPELRLEAQCIAARLTADLPPSATASA